MKTKRQFSLFILLLSLLTLVLGSCVDNAELLDEATARDAVIRQQAVADGSEPVLVIDESVLTTDCEQEFYLAIDDRGQEIVIAESCDDSKDADLLGIITVPCPPVCDTGRQPDGPISPAPPPCPPVCDTSSGIYFKVSDAIGSVSSSAAMRVTSSDASSARERYQKARPNALRCFVIDMPAKKWLSAKGGSVAVVLPARDKDNKQIALLSGYKKDGSRIGDNHYYQLKPACR